MMHDANNFLIYHHKIKTLCCLLFLPKYIFIVRHDQLSSFPMPFKFTQFMLDPEHSNFASSDSPELDC